MDFSGCPTHLRVAKDGACIDDIAAVFD